MLKNSTQSAFSLVELLIVLAVLTVLTGLTLSSLTTTSDTQNFNNNFDKILSNINNARSLAISAKGQPDYVNADQDTLTGNDDFVTPVNYGVNFDNSAISGPHQIILFADNHQPLTGSPLGTINEYDDIASCTSPTSGCDFALQTTPIDPRYNIEVYKSTSSLKTGSDGANSTGTSILYAPLTASFRIHPALTAPKNFLLIRLQEKDGAKRCRQITMHYRVGNPEVQNCQ